MKTKTLFYMALTAVMTALAACSQDDEPMDAAPKPAAIEFEITDGGFADAQTRVVEEGLSTKFEAGDKCGLYIVRNGALVASNVVLTAEEGENGTITWKAADGAISGAAEGDKYFLSCPLMVPDMENKVTPSATDSDDAFFAKIISAWRTAPNQNDYASYRYSDLMTAAGEVKDEDGKLKVSFSLNHKMALAVIEVPKQTKYNFTNITGGAEYIVPTRVDFSGSNSRPLRMEDGTYRFVFNPKSTDNGSIIGTVPGGKKFTIGLSAYTVNAGRCKRFKVKGGADGTPIEKSHELQVGDYLLKDGNLIEKGETLTAEQKADVAAIVFWSPAETAADGRTTPASLTDDKIMAAEHPNCNHGLAVAVKELKSYIVNWQTSAESVEEFRNSDNFTHANKDKFVSIASAGIGKEDNINRILGYQNTQVLLAYNKYCNNNDRISYTVNPAVFLAEFANSNPAPTGSTGWFLPSPKELHMLCYKDVDNIYSVYNFTETFGKVNTSLTAVSGENLRGATYWSSSEETDQSKSFSVKFTNALVGKYNKTSGFYARAVLAF